MEGPCVINGAESTADLTSLSLSFFPLNVYLPESVTVVISNPPPSKHRKKEVKNCSEEGGTKTKVVPIFMIFIYELRPKFKLLYKNIWYDHKPNPLITIKKIFTSMRSDQL